MTHYVEDMLDDLKRAHRVREEQLSSAANMYKQRHDKVVSRHGHLLVAYRHACPLLRYVCEICCDYCCISVSISTSIMCACLLRYYSSSAERRIDQLAISVPYVLFV